MKNKFIFFILLVGLVSILAGCGEDAEKEDLVRSSYPDDLRNSETITICAQQTAYSLSDDVELLLDIENHSTKDVAADEYFQLEKKVEGEWYIAVSYTHLDVYKRQCQRCRRFFGGSMAGSHRAGRYERYHGIYQRDICAEE